MSCQVLCSGVCTAADTSGGCDHAPVTAPLGPDAARGAAPAASRGRVPWLPPPRPGPAPGRGRRPRAGAAGQHRGHRPGLARRAAAGQRASARSTAGRPTGPSTSSTGLLVDNRVLPVFALLLGYGVAVRLGRPGRPDGAGRARAPRDGAGPAGTPRRGRVGVGAAPGGRAARARRPARRPGPRRGRAGRRSRCCCCSRCRWPGPAPARTCSSAVLAVPALLVHGAVDGFGGSLGFPDAPQDYLLSVVDRVGHVAARASSCSCRPTGACSSRSCSGVRLARARLGAGARPAPARAARSSGSAAGAGRAAGGGAVRAGARGGRLPDVVVGLWAGVLDAVTGPVGRAGRGVPRCSRPPRPSVRRRGGPAAGRRAALAPCWAGASPGPCSTSRTPSCSPSSSRRGRAGRAARWGSAAAAPAAAGCGRSRWSPPCVAAARRGAGRWRGTGRRRAGSAERAAGPGPQLGDVVRRGAAGLGRVGDEPQRHGARQPALVGVEHVEERGHLALEASAPAR